MLVFDKATSALDYVIDGIVTALSRDAVLSGDTSGTDQAKSRSADTAGSSYHPAGMSYKAEIALSRSWIRTELGRMALGPGMSVTAEIYTGRRSVISFLLSPLQRMTQESLHER